MHEIRIHARRVLIHVWLYWFEFIWIGQICNGGDHVLCAICYTRNCNQSLDTCTGEKNITVFWGKWDKSNCTHLQKKKYTKTTVGGIIDALTSMVPRVKIGVHFNQVYIRFLSALYSHSRARLCQGQQREVTQQLPQHHTFVLLSIALLAGSRKQNRRKLRKFPHSPKIPERNCTFFYFLFFFLLYFFRLLLFKLLSM